MKKTIPAPPPFTPKKKVFWNDQMPTAIKKLGAAPDGWRWLEIGEVAKSGDFYIVGDSPHAVNTFRGEVVTKGNFPILRHLTRDRKPRITSSSRTVYVKELHNCARCGGTHEFLFFKKMRRPHRDMTHWCSCPSSGDPILMKVEP